MTDERKTNEDQGCDGRTDGRSGYFNLFISVTRRANIFERNVWRTRNIPLDVRISSRSPRLSKTVRKYRKKAKSQNRNSLLLDTPCFGALNGRIPNKHIPKNHHQRSLFLCTRERPTNTQQHNQLRQLSKANYGDLDLRRGAAHVITEATNACSQSTTPSTEILITAVFRNAEDRPIRLQRWCPLAPLTENALLLFGDDVAQEFGEVAVVKIYMRCCCVVHCGRNNNN